MVSSKERLRIARWIDNLIARINRQKGSINRLLLANIELAAALSEIADAENGPKNIGQARKRAQAALDSVAQAAAAIDGDKQESEEDRTIDEELKKHGH